MVNPIRVNIAIKSFLSLLWLSGINSTTTTYIIAPAAKASKKGSKILIFSASMAPMTPAIGSTIPLRLPNIKDFFLDNPYFLRGTLTAVPSGKFCIPIPKARRQADVNVAPSSP